METRKPNTIRCHIPRRVPGGTLGMLSAMAVLLCLLASPTAGWTASAPIGTVDYARGAVTARGEDGDLRILGKGAPLHEKDVLTTGKNGTAVIRLNDDSKITVRPNTVFALEEYAHGGQTESAVLRLFKGGIRALTGLIAKRNPNSGFRLHTATAVVGVRGTDFEARLCEGDACAQGDDDDQPAADAKTPPVPVAGRVLRLQGTLTAQSKNGATRRIVDGGPVYEGDILETEKGGFAVVVFRDQSRISLQSGTRFEVAEYRYETEQKGSVLFRLVKGGLRFMSGLMAKRNPESFKIGTPTAVVGVRGTLGWVVVPVDLPEDLLQQMGIDPEQVTGGFVILGFEEGSGTLTAGQQTWDFGPGTSAKYALWMTGPSYFPDPPTLRWLGPELKTIEIPKGLFSEGKRVFRPGTLLVSVNKGKVGFEGKGGLIVLSPGQIAFLDPTMGMPEALDPVWFNRVREQLPILDPADMQQWIKDNQDAVNKALGNTGGGGDCECIIVF